MTSSSCLTGATKKWSSPPTAAYSPRFGNAPGKSVIQVLNYGLDPVGQEKTRSAKLLLNLKALGVPVGIKPSQIRVSEMLFNDGRVEGRYADIFDWYKALPDSPRRSGDPSPKVRPSSAPTLDPVTGVLEGVELFYHDSRYLLVTWDDRPPIGRRSRPSSARPIFRSGTGMGNQPRHARE